VKKAYAAEFELYAKGTMLWPSQCSLLRRWFSETQSCVLP